jgi:hypothetical protein
MESEVISLLQDIVVVVGSLGALTFLLPPQLAKYFNVIGKVAEIIGLGLKKAEEKNLYKKGE